MESETGKSLTPCSGMNRGQILDGVFMMGSLGERLLGRQHSRNAMFHCDVTKSWRQSQLYDPKGGREGSPTVVGIFCRKQWDPTLQKWRKIINPETCAAKGCSWGHPDYPHPLLSREPISQVRGRGRETNIYLVPIIFWGEEGLCFLYPS